MTTEAQSFWDELYRTRGHRHRGEPHPSLVGALADAPPGTALELGSGDGTSAVWLATRGWTVTAVDVSQVALDLAAAHAAQAGVLSRVDLQRADVGEWTTTESFDLVAALFLHTPLELDCAAVLARLAAQTRKDGVLLSVGHYTLPPWAWDPEDTDGLPSASQLASALGTQDPEWRTVFADERPRTVTDRDGRASTVLDAVLHVTRVATPGTG